MSVWIHAWWALEMSTKIIKTGKLFCFDNTWLVSYDIYIYIYMMKWVKLSTCDVEQSVNLRYGSYDILYQCKFVVSNSSHDEMGFDSST